MLQPASAWILLDPCLMPPGPNLAPGRAVTPYIELAHAERPLN